MKRHTRYQGAILRDHHVLIIAHRENATGRTYWLLPGGGIEPGESEEECVQREMFEETGLEVRVERLLLDVPSTPGSVYERLKTYQCAIVSGEAAPGYEPELEASAMYSIVEVAWLDLRDPSAWPDIIIDDRFTHPNLLRVRQALLEGNVEG